MICQLYFNKVVKKINMLLAHSLQREIIKEFLGKSAQASQGGSRQECREAQS